jgi:hypothetical protein
MWLGLVHPGRDDNPDLKGTTLMLDPGEEVEMETPPDVFAGDYDEDGNEVLRPWEDPWLKPVTKTSKSAKSSTSSDDSTKSETTQSSEEVPAH